MLDRPFLDILAALDEPLASLCAAGILGDPERTRVRAMSFARAALVEPTGAAGTLVLDAPLETLVLAALGCETRLVVAAEPARLAWLAARLDHLGVPVPLLDLTALPAVGLAPFARLVISAAVTPPPYCGAERVLVVPAPGPAPTEPPWHPGPGWSLLGAGDDATVYRRGDELLRVARHPASRAGLLGEAAWTTWLAPRVPAAIPSWRALVGPVAALSGPYLPGRRPTPAQLRPGLARTLAGFLAALHAVDPRGAPTACAVDRRLDTSPARALRFVRGTHDLVDPESDPRLAGLGDRLVAAIAAFLSAPPPPPPPVLRAIHGDLDPGNLLVDDDGALTAVIDWSDSGAGDPMRDLGGLAAFGEPGFAAALLAGYGRLCPEDAARCEFYRRWQALDAMLVLSGEPTLRAAWLPALAEVFAGA